MARLNTIADGQPFTYQLLNGIIEAINNIKIPEGDDGADEELVKIVGPGLDPKNKPMIVFGREDVSISGNETGANGSITFGKDNGKGQKANFNNENPIVVASIVDAESGGGVPIGYLTITSVTNSEFKYRIKLIRKREKVTPLQINYVAFGVTSK
jgi:hypothetical protein